MTDRREHGGLTQFGVVLAEYRRSYGIPVRSLIGAADDEPLTVTQSEAISRLSHDAGKALSMTLRVRGKLINDIIVAYRRVISSSHPGIEVPQGFTLTMQERLGIALTDDASKAYERPMSENIARRLSELTGRPITQISLDLDAAGGDLDKLFSLWRGATPLSAT